MIPNSMRFTITSWFNVVSLIKILEQVAQFFIIRNIQVLFFLFIQNIILSRNLTASCLIQTCFVFNKMKMLKYMLLLIQLSIHVDVAHLILLQPLLQL